VGVESVFGAYTCATLAPAKLNPAANSAIISLDTVFPLSAQAEPTLFRNSMTQLPKSQALFNQTIGMFHQHAVRFAGLDGVAMHHQHVRAHLPCRPEHKVGQTAPERATNQ